MADIIRHNRVVQDNWQVVPATERSVPPGEQLLLPLALWQQHATTLAGRQDIGVWLDSHELPSAELVTLPLIAVNFPVFTDGRGFSIARILRDRLGYRRELRAMGYVLRDQLCFLKRCGFDSFVLQPGVDLQAAIASLEDFTEYYQGSVDQPQPLFRRA